MSARKKISVSILTHILPRLATEAKRKHWDIDLLIEEALIHYLDIPISKRPYTGDMKKPLPKLGSGKRFANLKNTLSKEKGVTDPAALAAAIGRKKYGKAKMAKMAAKGKKK